MTEKLWNDCSSKSTFSASDTREIEVWAIELSRKKMLNTLNHLQTFWMKLSLSLWAFLQRKMHKTQQCFSASKNSLPRLNMERECESKRRKEHPNISFYDSYLLASEIFDCFFHSQGLTERQLKKWLYFGHSKGIIVLFLYWLRGTKSYVISVSLKWRANWVFLNILLGTELRRNEGLMAKAAAAAQAQ